MVLPSEQTRRAIAAAPASTPLPARRSTSPPNRSPDHVDGRIDVYALGAVAYFLLTGAPPFDGRTVVEICGHHLHTPPEPPSSRLGRPVPSRLEALVLSCLAKDPNERSRDAQELLTMLSDCESESPFSAADARSWWFRFRETSSRAA